MLLKNRFTYASSLLLLTVGLTWSQAASGEQPTKRPTDEERGKELYERHCDSCHGGWARGKGPATQALVRPVPNLEGKVEADDKTIMLVMRGKGAMPSYEQTFDRFDAKRVLQHMAKLKGPAPKAPADAPTETDAPAEAEAPTEPPADTPDGAN